LKSFDIMSLYARYKICFYESTLELAILSYRVVPPWLLDLFPNYFYPTLLLGILLFCRQLSAWGYPGSTEGFHIVKNTWLFIFTIVLMQQLTEPTNKIFVIMAPYICYCLVNWVENLQAIINCTEELPKITKESLKTDKGFSEIIANDDKHRLYRFCIIRLICEILSKSMNLVAIMLFCCKIVDPQTHQFPWSLVIGLLFASKILLATIILVWLSDDSSFKCTTRQLQDCELGVPFKQSCILYFCLTISCMDITALFILIIDFKDFLMKAVYFKTFGVALLGIYSIWELKKELCASKCNKHQTSDLLLW
jgi:hypothetical protein